MSVLKILKLNLGGDLDVTNGALSLVEDADAIKQQIPVELQYWKRDFFLDQQEGLERKIIFGKKVVDIELESEYKTALTNATGVTAVESLLFEKDEKVLKITGTVRTILADTEEVEIEVI